MKKNALAPLLLREGLLTEGEGKKPWATGVRRS